MSHPVNSEDRHNGTNGSKGRNGFGLPDDIEPFAELRDTRKLNDNEKKRAAEAAGVRKRTMRG